MAKKKLDNKLMLHKNFLKIYKFYYEIIEIFKQR